MLAGCCARGLSASSSESGKCGAQPLAVPVLHSIDPGVENGEYDFEHATDPTPEDQKVDMCDFYATHKDDLLLIGICGIDGLGGAEVVKVVRVNQRGDINIPFIPTLHVAGLTEIELEQAIVEAYGKVNLEVQASISD
jgi:polysaccharide biosynthesis/export protein